MEEYHYDLLENAVSHHGLELLEIIHREQKSQSLPSRIGTQGVLTGNKEDDYRKKLHQFIGRNADVLFKLGDGEARSKAEKCDRYEADLYAVMPPLEAFMDVQGAARRRHFYKSVAKGDTVIATVASVQESGVMLMLMCLDYGNARHLSSLRITAFCPLKELPRKRAHEDPLDNLKIKDKVRAVITSVNVEGEKLTASMLPWAVPEDIEDIRLGPITDEEMPINYVKAKEIDGQTYAMMMETNAAFQNSNMESLMSKFLIEDECPPSFMISLKNLHIPKHEYAEELRKMQSYKWSLRSVAEGVSHFKAGRFTEAMQHLNKALQIDPENVEALVARGALYANNESYLRAIEDFERSLELNPMHANARKYICQTLVAYGRSLQEQKKYRDAMAFYKRALSINTEFLEAKECIAELDIQSTDEPEDDVNYMDLGYIHKSSESPEREEEAKGSGLEKTTETLKRLIEEDEKGTRKKRRSKRADSPHSGGSPVKSRRKEDHKTNPENSGQLYGRNSYEAESDMPPWKDGTSSLQDDPYFPDKPATSFMNVPLHEVPLPDRNNKNSDSHHRSSEREKSRERYGSRSPHRYDYRSPQRSRRSTERSTQMSHRRSSPKSKHLSPPMSNRQSPPRRSSYEPSQSLYDHSPRRSNHRSSQGSLGQSPRSRQFSPQSRQTGYGSPSPPRGRYDPGSPAHNSSQRIPGLDSPELEIPRSPHFAREKDRPDQYLGYPQEDRRLPPSDNRSSEYARYESVEEKQYHSEDNSNAFQEGYKKSASDNERRQRNYFDAEKTDRLDREERDDRESKQLDFQRALSKDNRQTLPARDEPEKELTEDHDEKDVPTNSEASGLVAYSRSPTPERGGSPKLRSRSYSRRDSDRYSRDQRSKHEQFRNRDDGRSRYESRPGSHRDEDHRYKSKDDYRTRDSHRSQEWDHRGSHERGVDSSREQSGHRSGDRGDWREKREEDRRRVRKPEFESHKPFDKEYFQSQKRDDRRSRERDGRRSRERDDRRSDGRDGRGPLERDDRRSDGRDENRLLERSDHKSRERYDRRSHERDGRRSRERDGRRSRERDSRRFTADHDRRSHERDDHRSFEKDQHRPNEQDGRSSRERESRYHGYKNDRSYEGDSGYRSRGDNRPDGDRGHEEKDMPDKEVLYGKWEKPRVSRFDSESMLPPMKNICQEKRDDDDSKKKILMHDTSKSSIAHVAGSKESFINDMYKYVKEEVKTSCQLVRNKDEFSVQHAEFVKTGWQEADTVSTQKKFSDDLKVKIAFDGSLGSRRVVKDEVPPIVKTENVEVEPTPDDQDEEAESVAPILDFDELQKKLQQYWKTDVGEVKPLEDVKIPSRKTPVQESEPSLRNRGPPEEFVEDLIKPETTYRKRKLSSGSSSSSSSLTSVSNSSGSRSRSRSKSCSRSRSHRRSTSRSQLRRETYRPSSNRRSHSGSRQGGSSRHKSHSRSHSRNYSRSRSRGGRSRSRSGSRRRHSSYHKYSRSRSKHQGYSSRHSRSRSRGHSRQRRYSRSGSRSRRTHDRGDHAKFYSHPRDFQHNYGPSNHPKAVRGRNTFRPPRSASRRSHDRDESQSKYRWWSPSKSKIARDEAYVKPREEMKNESDKPLTDTKDKQNISSSTIKPPAYEVKPVIDVPLKEKEKTTPVKSSAVFSKDNIFESESADVKGHDKITFSIKATPAPVPKSVVKPAETRNSLLEMEKFLQNLKEKKKEELTEKFKFQLKKKPDNTVW
ncbi:zinc finger CCCH domain-containing protein 13-like isoform X2 [Lineus longissimus]